MKREVIQGLVFLALSSIVAIPQDHPVTFVGEATEGQTFRKDIGHGLDFVLMPNSNGVTGWTIEVTPQSKPSDPECEDFLSVVTPPYHFQNARYLDTGYGITAQEAVRYSPREFSFVLNCSDYKTESKRVDLAIYPSAASKQEVDHALAKLGSSPVGKGRLWVEDSKITAGHESGSTEDLGTIHWIKFKVEIKFPAAPPPHPKP